MTTTLQPDAHEHAGVRRRWVLLIPAILVIYIIAYIDRVNISFAISHLKDELEITSAQAGFAAGIFFIGYLLLQVPGGYLAQRWSAKRLLIILLTLWGLLAAGCGLVQSYEQLLTLRFFLGVVEGAVQPALMVLLTRWFPVRERGRAFSLFIMHNPIAVIIAAPLSGFILSIGGWRELFIIEGLGGLVIGLLVWTLLAADSPEQARWLSSSERREIAILKQQDPVVASTSVPSAALRSGAVWVLAAAAMFVWLGFYGLQLWLPSLLRSSFTGELTIGLVAAIPPICAAVAIWLNGRGADRDQRYALRVMTPLVLGGLILITSTFVTADHRWLIVAALALATACQLSFFGPFWSLASQRVPAVAVGVGYGIINGIGNLGGLLGPYVGGWLEDVTGSLRLSSMLFGGSVIFAGLIVGTVFARKSAKTAVPASTRLSA
jgi:MFS family permease